MASEKLIFGIYPFNSTGMAVGIASGRPDDFHHIGQAIIELKGESKHFVIRNYFHYTGPESAQGLLDMIMQLLKIPMEWDIVLCFRYTGADLDDWLNLIRSIIEQFGTQLSSLQITGEASSLHLPGSADGASPNVKKALVEGILAARKTIVKTGAITKIGFATVPPQEETDAEITFWKDISALGGSDFAKAVDYVGLDYYPDVFHALDAGEIPGAIAKTFEEFRATRLAVTGFPDNIPIRITENGWPTNSKRSNEKQAITLELVIRTINELKEKFNITHYELFNLRDADSTNDNFFYQFGIVRDDYTPKPAFNVYKKLIQELGK